MKSNNNPGTNDMSTKYRKSKDVPNDILCKRLDELWRAVTKGRDGINREFYMSIPAQVDNDADLVISEASRRIKSLQAQVDRYKEALEKAKAMCSDLDMVPCIDCGPHPFVILLYTLLEQALKEKP